MTNQNSKLYKRIKRHRRVRAKISGTDSWPRLSVYRSSRYIYVQLVDDIHGKTLLGISDKPLRVSRGTGPKASEALSKSLRAHETGKLLAKRALDKGIKKVIFDRGGYKYHGRVKHVAEGAREGGLIF